MELIVLQHYFKVRMAEAKKAIPDSTTGDSGNMQRLKLKLSGSKEEQPQQKITLRMGGRKDSPGMSPAPKAGSPAVQPKGSNDSPYHSQGTSAFATNSSHIPHHPPAHPFDSKWRQPGKGEYF